MRNEACPIQVTQISPSRTVGNLGAAGPPARFTKSDGIRTLVRKLRLCQSACGRSRTRVERFPAPPPSADPWRTMFRRLLLGKRIGTRPTRYDSEYCEATPFARCLTQADFRVELCGYAYLEDVCCAPLDLFSRAGL